MCFWPYFLNDLLKVTGNHLISDFDLEKKYMEAIVYSLQFFCYSLLFLEHIQKILGLCLLRV